MYLCKYPFELADQAYKPGDQLSDETVSMLPAANRLAFLNMQWLVKLDDKGKEPNRYQNKFKADWDWNGEKARAEEAKRTRDGAGRITSDVDDAAIARQRSEDICLSPEGLASVMPGGTLPIGPDFESMEYLPDSQRNRIKAGKAADDVLDLDAQEVEVEVKPGAELGVDSEGEGEAAFECAPCERVFASSRALKVHQSREHGG